MRHHLYDIFVLFNEILGCMCGKQGGNATTHALRLRVTPLVAPIVRLKAIT